MTDFDSNVSPYIRKHPIRDLCRCKRGPVREEAEMCQHCEDDAQANLITLDEMQAHRIYAGDKR